MIAIIDYGAGNTRSVTKALNYLGIPWRLTDVPIEILAADKVIFPGQGHFGMVMNSLREKELIPTLQTVLLTKPYLGICVGMQILFELSEEAPGIQGLGIFKGSVHRFTGRKIPQIGWNLSGEKYYYFANSYYCTPEAFPGLMQMSEHEEEPFCSSLSWKNIRATQFHPEKSSQAGLEYLRNFCEGRS